MELRIYELGFSFRGRSVLWSSISRISPGGEVILTDNKKIFLPRSLTNFDLIVNDLRRSVAVL